MPLLDLFARIDADNRRRRFRVYAASFALGVCLLGGAWVDGTLNRPAHSPEACAQRLGVTYNVEDGATEQLAAFKACVGR